MSTEAQNLENQTAKTVVNNEPKKKSKLASVTKLMGATGVGVLIGGVGIALTSAQLPDQPAEADTQSDDLSNLVDGQLPVASSVTEDMSFAEAFAAARAEVGPGGVFQWHGQIFGTYTRAEWDAMSQAERAEYGSHFEWNDIDAQGSDVAIAATNRQDNRRQDNESGQDENNEDKPENGGENVDKPEVADNGGEDGPGEEITDVAEVTTEEVAEVPTEDVTEVTTEDVAEVPTEDITEVTTEDVAEVPTEDVTEEQIQAMNPVDEPGIEVDIFPEDQYQAMNPVDDHNDMNPVDNPNDTVQEPEITPEPEPCIYGGPTGSDLADNGDYVNDANVDGFLS